MIGQFHYEIIDATHDSCTLLYAIHIPAPDAPYAMLDMVITTVVDVVTTVDVVPTDVDSSS